MRRPPSVVQHAYLERLAAHVAASSLPAPLRSPVPLASPPPLPSLPPRPAVASAPVAHWTLPPRLAAAGEWRLAWQRLLAILRQLPPMLRRLLLVAPFTLLVTHTSALAFGADAIAAEHIVASEAASRTAGRHGEEPHAKAAPRYAQTERSHGTHPTGHDSDPDRPTPLQETAPAASAPLPGTEATAPDAGTAPPPARLDEPGAPLPERAEPLPALPGEPVAPIVVAPQPAPAGVASAGLGRATLAIASASLFAALLVAVACLVARHRASHVSATALAEVAPQVEPEAPTEALADAPWTLGFATDRGRVRARNEDAGCAFRVATDQIAIVADGLGGMPDGADASALAVRAAARALRRGWRTAPSAHPPAPAILLHAAFAAAAARLATRALRRGFVSPREGLRTTLIVAIARADSFHFAYIGDGGIFLVRSGGAFETLMAPQKAGEELNRLAASLGPFLHGAPVLGSVTREPGDLLVLASDGVADRLQPRFYTDLLLRHARNCGGDLAAAARRVLGILASHVEEGLFRFDDNMTLALIGDGQPPPLGQDAAAAVEAA